jgi:hypothetical protein
VKNQEAHKKYRDNVTPFHPPKSLEITEDEASCRVIDPKPLREKSTKE